MDGTLNNLYDIDLMVGGESFQPDGTVTVKLLIADLLGKDLKVFRFEPTEA